MVIALYLLAAGLHRPRDLVGTAQSWLYRFFKTNERLADMQPLPVRNHHGPEDMARESGRAIEYFED